MFINRPKCKIAWTDCLLTILAVLFMIGIRWWFPTCDVMGEKIMSCHWAGEMLKALSWLLLVLTVLHLVWPEERIEEGIAVSTAGVAVLTAMVPGHIISLCANPEMTCRHSTAWMTTLFMAAVVLTVLVDVFLYRQIVSGKKHKRKGAEKGL